MVTTKMSMPSRLEYLKKIKPRYLKSTKEEKHKTLNEFCKNTGYNRKYAIRRLSAKVSLSKSQSINKKRKYIYSKNDIYLLSKIWEIMDYPCGQRLQPNLGEIIDKLIKHKELNVSGETAAKLKNISSASIDNRLKPYRIKLRRKINGTTKPGSLVKKQIPIRTSSWNEKRIGCCELDTVAHCGQTAAGEFINSLNLTDILTGWTETEAIIGKAQKRIITSLENIKSRLPFKLKAIDPDNGSEFINWQLFHYCMEREIEFTRGRPYQKNDNAHIEQKNWTHIRKVFGYRRLENTKQLNLMNDLYRNELRLYQNFFMPCVKLINKKRIGRNGEKIRRIYDRAKTPYQKVLACKQINRVTKQKLKEQYDKLNPAALRRNIIKKLNQLSKLKN